MHNESKVPKRIFPVEPNAQYEALDSDWQMKEFSELRENRKNNPYEPSYHFSSPEGMINDPNGLCFWNGKYHMFYQAYPLLDPRPHWGHTISDDMVYWKDLPTAIYPDIEYAVFSGSSLVEEDRVIAMFHGTQVGNMIAISADPLLLNWEKNSHCPVIPMIPDSATGLPYRVFDPFIWKETDGYYALSGSYFGGGEDQRSTGENNRMVEHLFFSQDLSRWSYLGPLMNENPFVTIGNDGACPYFWPIGKDKHVLFFFSHRTGPYILLGSYDKVVHKFTPEKCIQVNHGPVGCSSLQAPCATPDGKGGCYLIYNTKDANHTLTRKGTMTIMQHITLDNAGDIRINPVQQIENIRVNHWSAQAFSLKGFQEYVLPVTGKCLEISSSIDLKDARSLELKVFRSPEKEEYTSITIHRSKIKRATGIVSRMYLTVDTIHSSRLQEVEARIPETTEFACDSDQHVDLRVFIDKCIVEVFVNERAYAMQMVYPSHRDSNGISIEAIGGTADILTLDTWEMKTIY